MPRNYTPKYFRHSDMVIKQDIDGFGCLFLSRVDKELTRRHVNGVSLSWELYLDSQMYNENTVLLAKTIFSLTDIDFIRFTSNMKTDNDAMNNMNSWLLKLALGIPENNEIQTQEEDEFYKKTLQIRNVIREELSTKCNISVTLNQVIFSIDHIKQ